jgi:hypothetical protein
MCSETGTGAGRHIILKELGKIKVKVTLEQATKDQRGSRGIALLFP